MNQFTPEDAHACLLDLLDSGDLSDSEVLQAQLLFGTFIDEALFFWGFLRPMLSERKPIDAMEVGSGVGLLSLFASAEVKEFTSLEPESAGFGQMSTFRRAILSAWQGQNMPVFKESFIHDLPRAKTFDFIYCINVLEHVPQPEKLLDEVFERLKPGGTAWFVLPNYSFPYEQHFEIPILFNKRVTEKIFGARIRRHSVSSDPVGLWAELSWPTQSSLKKFFLSRGWSHEFRKNVLRGYFERLREPIFVQRKGTLYKSFHPLLRLLKPAVLAVPLGVAPIIEFTLSRPSGPQSKSFDIRP